MLKCHMLKWEGNTPSATPLLASLSREAAKILFLVVCFAAFHSQIQTWSLLFPCKRLIANIEFAVILSIRFYISKCSTFLFLSYSF